MINDERLQNLCVARAHMLKDLAAVLRRVGYNHPQRAKTNAHRTKRRKVLRSALHLNAECIASRVLELMDFTSPPKDGQ